MSLPATPSLDQAAAEFDALPAAGEYLSISQLCERIPYRPQTVRNLMGQGVFRLGQHYLKPRGRIVFKWSAVQAWLEGSR